MDQIINDIKRQIPTAKLVAVSSKLEKNGQFQGKVEIRVKKHRLYVSKLDRSFLESLKRAKKAALKQYQRVMHKPRRLVYQ